MFPLAEHFLTSLIFIFFMMYMDLTLYKYRKSFHTISWWASWTTWQYLSVFCVSFTEIPDYVERAIFSMSKPNDSMVVLNQRNCCLAAKLKIVSILGSGPSPSFFTQLFFNTWVMESYHKLIMKDSKRGSIEGKYINKWICYCFKRVVPNIYQLWFM